tara:strand:- start:2994 stop:3323 length:330 start_codon:yes stop_codon:yes gene_type:complete
MTTFSWQFQCIVATAKIDGRDDVIKELHWRLTAVSDDDPPISPSAYGLFALSDPSDDFVEFNSVTEDMCKSWVLAHLDQTEDEIKAALEQQIMAVKAPAMVTKVPSGWS